MSGRTAANNELLPILCVAAALAILTMVVSHRPDDDPTYTHQDYRDDVIWCVDHHYYPASAGVDRPVVCTNERGEEVKYPPHSKYAGEM